jgi:putative pyruvate formate lyase activating enzyme
MFEPGYVALHHQGVLAQRAKQAWDALAECHLCPQCCGADRLAGERGVCQTGDEAVVASTGPHFGEEAPLVGFGGSGTIFFGYCNLTCDFCQNYELSHLGQGQEVTAEKLADSMLVLQSQGCHNINWVSPSHVVAPLLAALTIAAGSGLRLPIVYNSGGYDSVETLGLLDGLVDIYMPDMKYDDDTVAWRYSRARNYSAVNRAAVREMHRQVGDLMIDEQGVARRGLLVRHLVLPDGLAGTKGIVEFIAEEISAGTYVNIMNQYRPCHRAGSLPPLDRRITSQEYRAAVQMALDAGLKRLDDRRTRSWGRGF